MKWINRRILCILGITALLTAWYAPPAAASDFPLYTYMAEDLNLQDHTPPDDPVENFTYYSWLYYQQAVPWGASPSILDDAQAAVTAWSSSIMIPNLKYSIPTPLEAAALRIYSGTCPGYQSAISCYKVADTHFYEEPHANYIVSAEIYISPNYTWSSSTRKAAIARELGRFYGLYDRKLTGPDACNPDEVSIMDFLVVNNQVVSHCDGIEGPTVLDKQRVDAYWSGGTPLRADLPVSAWGNGPVATFRWHDLAWAEKKQYLDFQYRINDSSPWVTYISAPNYTAYIGTHTYTEDRSLGIIIDISRPEYQDPIVPNGATWHRACAWAWFDAYQLWGNGQCSWAVQLVK